MSTSTCFRRSGCLRFSFGGDEVLTVGGVGCSTSIDDLCHGDVYRDHSKGFPLTELLVSKPISIQYSDPGSDPSLANDPRRRSTSFAASMSIEEIEALLQSARSNLVSQTNSEREEELGPGDLQHLRGVNPTHPGVMKAMGLPVVPPETFGESASRSTFPIADGPQSSSGLSTAAATVNSVESIPFSSHRSVRPTHSGGLTLDDLGDVELEISIVLGRAELLIEDILKLHEGSVVSLDQLAGDPVEIVANGRLVARGELIVIDGKFGVRLSEIL